MNSLCFVANPHFEESPSSILMRTAFHNGFSCVNTMAKALKIPGISSPLRLVLSDGPLCSLLCDASHSLEERLKESFYSQFRTHLGCRADILIAGMAVPWVALRRPQVFCPRCLQDGYLKFIQDIDGFGSCPYHGTAYLTKCAICERSFNWKSILDSHCLCGFDLRQSPDIRSDDQSGLTLLKIFRSLDQDAFNRTFAALNCLRFRYLKSGRRTDIFDTALNIGLKSKKCLHDLLTSDLLNYRQLPPQAIAAPWLSSEDEWIRTTTQKFVLQYSWRSTPCATQNCCANFGLTANDLRPLLSLSRTHLSEAVNSGKIKKQYIGSFLFYTSKHLCVFLRSINCKAKRPPVNGNLDRENYLCLSEIRLSLQLQTPTIKLLIARGLFGKVIIHNYSTLIEQTNVKKFDDLYISGSALALSLNVPARALHRILTTLGIKHLDLPPLPRIGTRVYLRTSITLKTRKQITKMYVKYIQSTLPKLHERTIANELKLKLPMVKYLLKNPRYYLRGKKKTLHPGPPELSKPLLTELKKWRKSHFTDREVADLANISYPDFCRRFLHNKTFIPTKILKEKFYDRKTLSSILRHTKKYISVTEVKKITNFNNATLNRVVRLGVIRKVYCRRKNGSDGLSLYYAADISNCKIQSLISKTPDLRDYNIKQSSNL